MKRTLAVLAVAILLSPAYAAAASDPTDRLGADEETIVPSPTTLRVPPCNCSGGRATLGALYVGFTALQVYDTYSTLAVLGHGGTEQNPVVGGLANRPAAFIAVKSAVTVTSIYAAEALWQQHHRVAAVLLMTASTSVMAAAAAHNSATLRSIR